MSVALVPRAGLKVADTVWIATALLHQRYPGRPSFPVAEIVEEVNRLEATEGEQISIYVHANLHCVANRPPNRARLRMLIETPDGGRRLFRTGDSFHYQRDGRTTPKPADLPATYLPLLQWYESWCSQKRHAEAAPDALLALRGSGRELWADEHADTYVDNLRREWP